MKKLKKMIKFLFESLPVSRRTYAKALQATNDVLNGLMESEANHSQIQNNIIQQMQIIASKINSMETGGADSEDTKTKSDVAFQ